MLPWVDLVWGGPLLRSKKHMIWLIYITILSFISHYRCFRAPLRELRSVSSFVPWIVFLKCFFETCTFIVMTICQIWLKGQVFCLSALWHSLTLSWIMFPIRVTWSSLLPEVRWNNVKMLHKCLDVFSLILATFTHHFGVFHVLCHV